MNATKEEQEKENLNTAITISLKKISVRARSEKEVIQFLTRLNFNQNIIDKAVEFLKNKKFLNDEDFARWWIEQRQTFRPKSTPVLKNELRQKGIDSQILEKILTENPEGELKSAQKLLEKNRRKFGDLTNRNNYQKAIQFFQRKGFKWEVIKKVLKSDSSKTTT